MTNDKTSINFRFSNISLMEQQISIKISPPMKMILTIYTGIFG